MKILIADPISFIGHLDYNLGMYRAMAGSHDCYLLTNEETKCKLMKKGVPEDRFLETYGNDCSILALSKKYRNKIVYHAVYRKRLLGIYRRIDRYADRFDAIILTSVEIYSFFLFSKSMRGNYAVMDHSIGNITTSKAYRAAWRSVIQRVKLIVFEDYIKEMAETALGKRAVYTVRHPLSAWDCAVRGERPPEEDCIRVFCPSASNYPLFLKQLESADIPDPVRFTVKVNGDVRNDRHNLTEYNTRLSESDYVRNISESDYVLLPYGPEYNYRYSGVLLEAIQLNKKALILNHNTLRYYVDIFPGHVFTFGTIDELLRTITEQRAFQPEPSDLSEYSDDRLREAIENCVMQKDD